MLGLPWETCFAKSRHPLSLSQATQTHWQCKVVSLWPQRSILLRSLYLQPGRLAYSETMTTRAARCNVWSDSMLSPSYWTSSGRTFPSTLAVGTRHCPRQQRSFAQFRYRKTWDRPTGRLTVLAVGNQQLPGRHRKTGLLGKRSFRMFDPKLIIRL